MRKAKWNAGWCFPRVPEVLWMYRFASRKWLPCHVLVDIPSWGLEQHSPSWPHFSALAGVTRSWFPQPSSLCALWCCEAFEGGEVLSEMHNLWHQYSFGRCLLKFAVESYRPAFSYLVYGFTVSTGMWWHAIFTCKTVALTISKSTDTQQLEHVLLIWHHFVMFGRYSIWIPLQYTVYFSLSFHCCSYIASWFNQSGSGNSIWALQ